MRGLSKYIKWAAALLISGACFANAALADLVAYEDVKSSGMKILTACPPSSCHVIAVGQSPAHLLAFLSNVHPHYAYGIPLSGFKYDPDGVAGPALSESLETQLFNHFDAYLNVQDLQGKRVLMLDYTENGDSLFSATKYFRKYLSTRRVKAAVLPYALTGSSNLFDNINHWNMPKIGLGQWNMPKIGRGRLDYKLGYEQLDTHTNSMLLAMHTQATEAVSPFGSFYIGSDPVGRVPLRPGFLDLSDGLRRMIEVDPDFYPHAFPKGGGECGTLCKCISAQLRSKVALTRPKKLPNGRY